jgi:hypothetical protein
MNTKRKASGKAVGEMTPEFVSYLMKDIDTYRYVKDEEGNVVGERTYKQILPEFHEDLEQARERRGFDDMESALRMASLYVAGAIEKVDPVTKAKLIEVPPIFEMAEDAQNYTSEDLNRLRNGGELDLDEGISKENIEEPLTENIEETIQPEQEGTIEEIEIEKPSVKTPPEVVEEEEVEQEDETLARTLGALKKVAKDLRRQGKGKSAWSIERVIKKYQGNKL